MVIWKSARTWLRRPDLQALGLMAHEWIIEVDWLSIRVRRRAAIVSRNPDVTIFNAGFSIHKPDRLWSWERDNGDMYLTIGPFNFCWWNY